MMAGILHHPDHLFDFLRGVVAGCSPKAPSPHSCMVISCLSTFLTLDLRRTLHKRTYITVQYSNVQPSHTYHTTPHHTILYITAAGAIGEKQNLAGMG